MENKEILVKFDDSEIPLAMEVEISEYSENGNAKPSANDNSESSANGNVESSGSGNAIPGPSGASQNKQRGGQNIRVRGVSAADDNFYDRGYPGNYKMPKGLTKARYESDSSEDEDDNAVYHKSSGPHTKFEQIIEVLENESLPDPIDFDKIKNKFKPEDLEYVAKLFNFWVTKRAEMQQLLSDPRENQIENDEASRDKK